MNRPLRRQHAIQWLLWLVLLPALLVLAYWCRPEVKTGLFPGTGQAASSSVK